jgi:hypothetical protein
MPKVSVQAWHHTSRSFSWSELYTQILLHELLSPHSDHHAVPSRRGSAGALLLLPQRSNRNVNYFTLRSSGKRVHCVPLWSP